MPDASYQRLDARCYQMSVFMFSMFSKSSKSPNEVMKLLRENFGNKEVIKYKEVSKQLANISSMLFGVDNQEFYTSGLCHKIVINLHKISHRGRKDIAHIFTNILQGLIGLRTPTVEYICKIPEIIFALCKGYEVEAGGKGKGAFILSH